MWLVEDHVFPAIEEARLLAALDEFGIAHRICNASALRSHGIEYSMGDVARGSCWWISQLSRSPHWRSEIWGSVDHFSYSNYAQNYGDLLLNFPFEALSFHEFGWRREEWYLRESSVFVRPDDGFKSFEGRLLTPSEFDKWVERMQLLQIRGSMPLIVAPPRQIVAEWRCVLVDGTVVGSSQYRPKQASETPQAVIQFAESVHASSRPPCRCYVMDIADTTNGFRIVEIGSLKFSSGMCHSAD